MTLETTRFGALAAEDAQTITFPDGLPGFAACRRFVFVPHPTAAEAAPSPFEWSMRPACCPPTSPPCAWTKAARSLFCAAC